MSKILFIVENNPLYRDQRVLSEIFTIKKCLQSDIFVIAPFFNKSKRGKKSKKSVKDICLYEYPCIEAKKKITQIIEYFISASFIFLLANYLIIKHKIDIVHIANPPDFLVLLLPASKIFNTKIIYDQHDLSLEIFKTKIIKPDLIDPLLNYFLSRFENFSYKLCDALVFPNEKFQKYYLNKSKTIKRNIIIRNGISENNIKFLSSFQELKCKRKELNLFSIIYIGIITKESGVCNLIPLAQALIKLEVRFVIQIYGEGTYLSELRESVKILKLNHYFNFHGFKKMIDIISEAQYGHVGIIPLPRNSKNNLATARKLYEYMFMALPVISLKLEETMMVADDCGFYCDDFEEMACLIKILSQQKEKLFEKGLKGHERFLKHYSWENQEYNLIDLYECLLNR